MLLPPIERDVRDDGQVGDADGTERARIGAKPLTISSGRAGRISARPQTAANFVSLS